MIQAAALDYMQKGYNIFLTGAPGSGKSYVIESFVKTARRHGKTVALTATTGIAASLLAGITIHSWTGIGIGRVLDKQFLENLLENRILTDRLNEADILIIDEISMLDGPTLDGLDQLLKLARSNSQAFGGIQVILSGDFFQLPPISQGLPVYAFQSEAWENLGLKVCYLTDQYRQRTDELSEILTALREKRFERRHLDLLTDRQGIEHQDTTMLLTHNKEVDEINETRLSQIKAKEHIFEMVFSGDNNQAIKLAKTVLAPSLLKLKVGASIMFVANDFSQGFANGTQGKIVGFKTGLPIVEVEGKGRKIKVEAHSWKHVIDNKILAEITQLPLRLAWAITIHKSQGMSLDEADIDLRRSFTYGMGYVALSRLRSYQGLYLRGINSRSLQLDSKIYDLDSYLRKSSMILTREVAQKVATKHSLNQEIQALLAAGQTKKFIKLSLGLSEKQWQLALSTSS